MLLPGGCLDGGDDLPFYAKFSKRTEGCQLGRLKITDGFIETNHAFLYNIFMIGADEKITAGLGTHKILVFINELETHGVTGLLRHAENSAAILMYPEYQLDMVRLGISLYGMSPSDDVVPSGVELQPAMEIKSHVAFLKTVPEGTPIGYNATFVTTKPRRIATVPVGYGDGYPRALSNCGRREECPLRLSGYGKRYRRELHV